MAGALSSLRVVELSDGPSIAFCGRQFAQWGAEVVVIEPPGGSPLRRWEPSVQVAGGRLSLEWEYLSANKKVKQFDLNHQAARDACLALIEQADVLITDWPQASRFRAGINFDRLAETAPRLVILSFSDFGRSGPYADYQATDIVLQALTGYMSFNGEPGKAPLKTAANALPHALGVSAFAGGVSALLERNRSGEGQIVEVSAMEAMASLMQYQRTEYYGTPMRRHGGVGPPMLPCEDTHLHFNYLLDRAREPLLVALGLSQEEATEDRSGIHAFLSEHTRRRRASDLFHELSELGATCAFVRDPQSLLEDEHLAGRGYFRELDTPAGALHFPGPPANMGRTPALAPRRASPFRGWRKRPAAAPPQAAGRHEAGLAPLAGLRVLDLTQAWLGPYAGMLLADLGADVIKVESHTRPDVWRGVSDLPPCARPDSHRWNTCHFFNSVNRNKRSLTLDLDDERGKTLFVKLVKTADVLLENYTPRVMDNFGLGYDELSKVNPRLVMVSFSGYGKTGPYRDFKAIGSSIEVVSGWLALFGYPGCAPMTMGEFQIDPMAGLHMAASALTGLLCRDRSGRGQAIEGSMMESAVGYIGEELLYASAGGEKASPMGNRHRQMAPHGLFRCAGEDQWVAISVRDDTDWQALVGLIGDPALRNEAYRTLAGRAASQDEIERVLSRWTHDQAAREVMVKLQAAGVPAGAFQTTAEALADPHFEARGWFTPMTHPDTGTHKYYGFPWSFSRNRLSAELPPPRLGEHSAGLLRSELHLSDAEIEDLFAAGVTGAVIDVADAPQGRRPPRQRG